MRVIRVHGRWDCTHHPLDPLEVLLEVLVPVAVAICKRDGAVVAAQQRRAAERQPPRQLSLQFSACRMAKLPHMPLQTSWHASLHGHPLCSGSSLLSMQRQDRRGSMLCIMLLPVMHCVHQQGGMHRAEARLCCNSVAQPWRHLDGAARTHFRAHAP